MYHSENDCKRNDCSGHYYAFALGEEPFGYCLELSFLYKPCYQPAHNQLIEQNGYYTIDEDNEEKSYDES